MLSKIFANIKLGISFWLVILSALNWGGTIYVNNSQNVGGFTPDELIKFVLPAAIILLAVFVSYFLFDKIYRVTKRNYYIPLIFVLIWAWQPALFSWQNAIALILSMAFYFTLQRISENSSEIISHYLNVGIISFLVSLLTPYGIYFLVLSIINTITNSNKNWRQIFLPFYGFALAFGIGYGLAFLMGLIPSFLAHYTEIIPTGTNWTSIQQNLYLIIPLAVLFIFSIIEFARSIGKAPVAKQKILGLLIWHFVLATLLLFAYNFETSFYGFVFFSIAILFANYLQFIRKYLWREIWIWILIAMNFVGLFF